MKRLVLVNLIIGSLPSIMFDEKINVARTKLALDMVDPIIFFFFFFANVEKETVNLIDVLAI